MSGDSTWEWVEENYNPDDISIRVAEVELIDQKRISKRLVDDIEALIIGLLQPLGNIQSMKAYYGRDLRISNVGDRGPYLGHYRPISWTKIGYGNCGWPFSSLISNPLAYSP